MIINYSKVYKNKTCIPKEIMEKYDIDNNSIVEWIIKDNDELKIRFRKKRDLRDMKGIIELDYSTDCIKLKKELYL